MLADRYGDAIDPDGDLRAMRRYLSRGEAATSKRLAGVGKTYTDTPMDG
jgi:hypothetical protein